MTPAHHGVAGSRQTSKRPVAVPAAYFDRLLAALDGSAEPNEALRKAARRPRPFTQS